MAARVSDGNGSFFESAIDFSSISAWDRYRSYSLNELVSYNGNLYLSNAGSGNSARTPGVHPYWTLQDVGMTGTYWTPIGSKTQLGGEFWEAYLSPYDNHLFTLDANGTLRTAATFDYESNATSYIIRVQVRDEHNASLDHNFTVSLNELYEPSRSNHLVDLNSTVKLEMIWVEPGTFTMGADLPHSAYVAHPVTLTKGFYLGKHEVTTAQYEAVMVGNPEGLSTTPSNHPNPNGPVAGVSWEHVQVFLSRLNNQNSANIPPGWKASADRGGMGICLSGGKHNLLFLGKPKHPCKSQFRRKRIRKSHNRRILSSKQLGFLRYARECPRMDAGLGCCPPSHQIDPTGAVSGTRRINRGGAWISPSSHVTSFSRNSSYPNFASGAVGFRLAFKKVTSFPTDLNSTAPLTIAENQPVGSFVGQFTAHDADANATLSYHLANGPGSKHNDRFSLDANGTLRTAKVFDYENRTTFKIRVQVADEHKAIQEAFIVSVTDLAESNVTTPDGNGTQVLPVDSNA